MSYSEDPRSKKKENTKYANVIEIPIPLLSGYEECAAP